MSIALFFLAPVLLSAPFLPIAPQPDFSSTQAVLTVIGVTLALAFLAESMVEYLFGQAVDHMPALRSWRWALMYVAALTGVGLASFYRLDLIELLESVLSGAPAHPSTWVGMALTGLGIGRGANYIHQFVSTYFPGKR